MDSRGSPIEDIHEELRAKLVSAITLGAGLYFRLTNAAADFKGKFCHPDKFPVEVFQTEAVEAGTYKAHPTGWFNLLAISIVPSFFAIFFDAFFMFFVRVLVCVCFRRQNWVEMCVAFA
jgi:hypothetical protein